MYLYEFYNKAINEHTGVFGFTQDEARTRANLGPEWVCVGRTYED
jgi:hypothetical protein